MLARVLAIAAPLAIDVSAMLPVLDAMAASGPARVSLHSQFSRLSVCTPWPDPDQELQLARRRLDVLGPGFPAQRRWLPALLGGDGRTPQVEVESIPDRAAIAFVARAVGERDASEDLAFLADHAGVEPAVARQLEGLIELAGGRCVSVADRCSPPALHTWTLELAMPWGSRHESASALAAADELAAVFGLGAAQRRLAAEVHAFLLDAEQCTLSLVTCRDEVLPYAELEYGGVPAHTAVRVLAALYPEHRLPTRLGALVAGAGATSIAALRLRLGDAGGIRARVSVDVT